jgi:cobalt/nickel transport system permease protein
VSRGHSFELIGVAGDPASPVHLLDPRAKILGLFAVTLVAVSTPIALWPVWIACAAALASVATVARLGPRQVWRRSRVIVPFALLAAVFVPFMREGGSEHALGPLSVSEAGLETLAEVVAKASIGTVSAVVLGATTAFPSVLRGLEALRVPRLLVLVAGLMYRYLFVVMEETRRTWAALVSRGYRPRHALQVGALGQAVSALFLRTYARAERVHTAMLARGFSGAMPHLHELTFRRADAAFVAGIAGALGALRVLLELAP